MEKKCVFSPFFPSLQSRRGLLGYSRAIFFFSSSSSSIYVVLAPARIALLCTGLSGIPSLNNNGSSRCNILDLNSSQVSVFFPLAIIDRLEPKDGRRLKSGGVLCHLHSMEYPHWSRQAFYVLMV